MRSPWRPPDCSLRAESGMDDMTGNNLAHFAMILMHVTFSDFDNSLPLTMVKVMCEF